MSSCSFVPPYLLERVAAVHGDAAVTACCWGTLALDAELRSRRAAASAAPPPSGPAPFGIHDAGGGTTLPGRLARSAGDVPVGDAAVDEAYTGVEASLALLRQAFGRASYDDRGAPVVATVHYGRHYDNAFWDGRQLVFGDGDGRVFDRFTKAVDVLGHELAHAVTEHTAGLEYSDQSGALNESFSDVFASCLKQWLLGQTADAADWLIGEGIFLPSVRGRALRSMAEPGTAYDDPVLGKDPQVGHLDDYVRTAEDNGGVHLNSGIPNKAFQLAAVAIGGASWEVTGPVWYAALTSDISSRATFAEFAAATVQAAAAVSEPVRAAVADGWAAVGVTPLAAGSAPASGSAGTAGGVVAVTRSGGFAGLRRSGEVRLGDDPRTSEVERLLAGIDLQRFGSSRPMPDRYVYEFVVDGRGVVLGARTHVYCIAFVFWISL
jgi:hypothetical protein